MTEMTVNIWTKQPKKWIAKFRYAKPLPSQGALLDVLDYDPETGSLTWKERTKATFPNDAFRSRWNEKNAGKPAFQKKDEGYWCGRVFGESYKAHRIIWKMVHGEDPICIDHINRDRSDNRLVNLRSVTLAENAQNRQPPMETDR